MNNDSILITSNFSSDTGFAWKFFYRLFNVVAGELYRSGVDICLSFARIVGSVDILDEDIPFTVFTFDPLHITLKGLLTLKNNIIQHNIQYCYLTDFPSWHWIYPFMRVCGIKKIIVHNHVSVPAPYAPKPASGLKKILKKSIHANKWLRADSVYVCSEFVKDRFVRVACCPENIITVITHGIDIERFSCNDIPETKEDKIVKILCVARATRHKGIHVLIDSAKILRDKFNFKNFIIEYGGDGPDMAQFLRQVKQNDLENHFLFLGTLRDTQPHICSADIIVVPSCWGDAYPLSVLEAMASGKPVIATNVGGIPEQIGMDGRYGILIPANDSVAIARNIYDLIIDEDRRKMIGKNARIKAERMFNEQRFYKNVLNTITYDLNIIR